MGAGKQPVSLDSFFAHCLLQVSWLLQKLWWQKPPRDWSLNWSPRVRVHTWSRGGWMSGFRPRTIKLLSSLKNIRICLRQIWHENLSIPPPSLWLMDKTLPVSGQQEIHQEAQIPPKENMKIVYRGPIQRLTPYWWPLTHFKCYIWSEWWWDLTWPTKRQC